MRATTVYLEEEYPMPLYEYRCEACGVTFEKLLPRAESQKKVPCPQCGSVRVRRLFSGFAIGKSGSSTSSSSVASCPTCSGGVCNLP